MTRATAATCSTLTAPMGGRLLQVKEVASRCGVGVHTVLAWIRSGELRAMNMGRTLAGRKPRWRVRPTDLANFEMVREAGPRTPKPRRGRRQQESVIQFYK
jgi:excisionase family DNA binding protein